MKIFISSLITGMEAERAAVKSAIEVFGHEPVMAENFSASPNSPQVECLRGLRSAELVIVILGPRYGFKQGGGISATHEEIREAQGSKQALVFMERDVVPEPDQAKLIEEVSGWEAGRFRKEYSSPEELGRLVTKGIHDFALAHATAPLDPAGLQARALSLFPKPDRQRSSTMLQVAIAAGPEQALLRPAEIEGASLIADLEQSLLFGQTALFERKKGIEHKLEGGDLVLFQEAGHGETSWVRLSPGGDMFFSLLLKRAEGHMGGMVVLEEDVQAALGGIIRYSAWLYGRIDPTERVTHVVPGARLTGEIWAWRTQAEHRASSGSMQVSFGNERQVDPILLSPAHQVRQRLSVDAHRIIEDFVTLLRRRWKQS